MMNTVYKCDCCGKELNHDDFDFYNDSEYHVTNDSICAENNLDFCKDCYQKIIDFLDSMIQKEDEEDD